MKRISPYLLSLCLALTSCDQGEDPLTAEEMVAQAKSEREHREETEQIERERTREANRKRLEAQLRENDEEKLEASALAAAQKKEEQEAVDEDVVVPEPEEAPEPIVQESFPFPNENEAAEKRQLAQEALMDEAIAKRKSALDALGKREEQLGKLQDIARRANAITGNMKAKRQGEANVAKGRARVTQAERYLQQANDRVKTLRKRRLGY